MNTALFLYALDLYVLIILVLKRVGQDFRSKLRSERDWLIIELVLMRSSVQKYTQSSDPSDTSILVPLTVYLVWTLMRI